MVSLQNANAQYAYSKGDKAAIFKNRKAGAVAFQTYDRNALYRIGLFFETIYRKYKDTSSHAAINCYQASVYSEGELYDNSLKAAFRLGQLYAGGVGTPVNPDKAAIFYLISGSQGKKELTDVTQKLCPSDTVLHNFSNRSALNDSLVICFNPFCQLQQPATMATLEQLAFYLKENPRLHIELRIAGPYEQVTAYYAYWKQAIAYKKISNQVQQYLYDKGVNPDQLLPLSLAVFEENKNTLLIVRLKDIDNVK